MSKADDSYKATLAARVEAERKKREWQAAEAERIRIYKEQEKVKYAEAYDLGRAAAERLVEDKIQPEIDRVVCEGKYSLTVSLREPVKFSNFSILDNLREAYPNYGREKSGESTSGSNGFRDGIVDEAARILQSEGYMIFRSEEFKAFHFAIDWHAR